MKRRATFRTATAVAIAIGLLVTAFGAAQLRAGGEERSAPVAPAAAKPVVVIETSLGNIEVELDPAKAPITVANFLQYVDDGFFNGTIFHRVIPGFMVQGGGFDAEFRKKPTRDPIKNEAANGLKNVKYTIAMARTAVVDSATAQFFLNVSDNGFLDHSSPDPRGFGYAVFGRVTAGTDVVDAIAAVRTGRGGPFPKDVPQTTVLIQKIRRK